MVHNRGKSNDSNVDEPRLPRKSDTEASTPTQSEPPIDSRFTLKATGIEAKTYDFRAARPRGKTMNFIESISHFIKSCLGAGIVAIHEEYMNCGLWTAVILNIFIGFAVAYGMYILAKSAQRVYGRVKVPMMSYSDVAEACIVAGPWDRMKKFGRTFRYIVDVILSIDHFGSCCVYQVVIARSIKQIVEGTNEHRDEGIPPVRVYILVLVLPSILICMIRTLKYLAPFSIVANFFILIVAMATIYYGTQSAEKPLGEFPAFKSIPGLFQFVGVCVFSLEGIGATLPIENNMKNPKQITLVIAVGMTVVIALNLTVGFFGYWGFGENAQTPVTLNFPMTMFSIILRGLMAFMVWVTFALNFWIPFNLLWVYISTRHDSEMHWLWERIYRGIMIVVITAIAVCFPSVAEFMGVIGAFCLSAMGFIFPALIELNLDWHDPGLGYMKWRLIKAIIIISFGIILCILGTLSSGREVVKAVIIGDKTSLDV